MHIFFRYGTSFLAEIAISNLCLTHLALLFLIIYGDPRVVCPVSRCDKLAPGVGKAKVVQESVGLRPCRHGGVRLEREQLVGARVHCSWPVVTSPCTGQCERGAQLRPRGQWRHPQLGLCGGGRGHGGGDTGRVGRRGERQHGRQQIEKYYSIK